ncbi:hypothetical protein [Pseudonocardia sp. NPDC046786]|uniref:hypothetical protein n=1 Tax=Pseudonocardia sp. NPDC046786 TaxID=3155471 RepID=UPI0033ECED75
MTLPPTTTFVPAPGADGLGAPWLLPGSERHYDDPAEAAWPAPRRSPQPVRTFT